eukprot:scaffold2614_cov85-Cyclotella_meneghiniana.AAC.1
MHMLALAKCNTERFQFSHHGLPLPYFSAYTAQPLLVSILEHAYQYQRLAGMPELPPWKADQIGP